MAAAYRMFRTRLVARERLSHSFVRLTLAGDDLGSCSPVLLDQRVKLAFGAAEQLGRLAEAEDWYVDWQKLGGDAPALRTYTLSAVRPGPDGSGEVDLDVVIHEHEPSAQLPPGSSFAQYAELGTLVGLVAGDRTRAGHDEVGVAWKGRHAREVLLIGDETALPAISNIVASLPEGCRGCVLLEVPHPSDVRQLQTPAGVELQWYVRHHGERIAHEQAAALAARVHVAEDELVWEEGEGSERFAWMAGEAGWVKQLRPVVSELGFSREQCSVMGYWKRTA